VSWERPPPALAGPLAPWLAELRTKLNAAVGRERVSWVNWWRSSAHNARVGGAASSQHLLGLAVDIVPEARARARIAQALRSQGLVVVDEGDHLHVQLSPTGTWNAVIARARARGLL